MGTAILLVPDQQQKCRRSKSRSLSHRGIRGVRLLMLLLNRTPNLVEKDVSPHKHDAVTSVRTTSIVVRLALPSICIYIRLQLHQKCVKDWRSCGGEGSPTSYSGSVAWVYDKVQQRASQSCNKMNLQFDGVFVWTVDWLTGVTTFITCSKSPESNWEKEGEFTSRGFTLV